MTLPVAQADTTIPTNENYRCASLRFDLFDQAVKRTSSCPLLAHVYRCVSHFLETEHAVPSLSGVLLIAAVALPGGILCEDYHPAADLPLVDDHGIKGGVVEPLYVICLIPLLELRYHLSDRVSRAPLCDFKSENLIAKAALAISFLLR